MLTVDFVAGTRGALAPAFRDGLFPLFVFRRDLKRRGIGISYYDVARVPMRPTGTVLCLNSRAFEYVGGRVSPAHMDVVKALGARYERVIWFDNRDSAGNTQFEVLPFVDIYCKKQLLRDRRVYRQCLYQNRVSADYIHRRYGVTDAEQEDPAEILEERFEQKLAVGWNIAYADYRSSSPRVRMLNIARWSLVPPACGGGERTIDVHGRFRTDFSYDTVGYPRRYLAEGVARLADVETRTGHVSWPVYRRELRHARAVLSPFGWGEICYRDFEAMMCGCALIKPSVGHLETWPDLFETGRTYIPLSWDLEECVSSLPDILRRREELSAVAGRAREAFQRLWSDAGRAVFCERFRALLSGTAPPVGES